LDTPSGGPRSSSIVSEPSNKTGEQDASNASDQPLNDRAEITPENQSLSTSFGSYAHEIDRDILTGMSANSLTARHQANILVANVRGSHVRVAANVEERSHKQLAEILPLIAPAPSLRYAPTTRAIGPGGRIRITIGGQSLATLLGWQPGSLTTTFDGAWVVLSPSPECRSVRRHDGRASFTTDLRLRLTHALCTRLELQLGDEVALVALPEHRALALCNPSRLLQSVPLSLLTAPASEDSWRFDGGSDND
jgi:hypothetical protein